MKKMFAVLLAALIAISVSMIITSPVLALHNSTVQWVQNWPYDRKTVTSYLNSTSIAFKGNSTGAFNATFSVTNLLGSPDDIKSVRVVIDRDNSGLVYFHFVAGYVYYVTSEGIISSVTGWFADPTEFDSRGWPGTVIFNGQTGPAVPLSPGVTYYFTMVFDQGPPTCKYYLNVYTEDQGTPTSGIPQTRFTQLWMTVDNNPPEITLTAPMDVNGSVVTNGSKVLGMLESHCGNNYFWLNFTADDIRNGDTTHATGILNYTITVDGVYFDSENMTSNSTAPYNKHKSYISTLSATGEYHYAANVSTLDVSKYGAVWALSNGTHTFKITVFDKVQWMTSITIHFNYTQPKKPFALSPSKGTSALKTYVTTANAESGLVTSTQYKSPQGAYENKTLGTLVTASGYNFGASLTLSITVYIPTYINYNATYHTFNILVYRGSTKADGTFSIQFVFPEAPAGLYNVTARTSVQWCSVSFNVTPEIVYTPDEVVGPCIITVEATGFTAQNATKPSFFFIVPDALSGANPQISHNWYIDGNGTLQNYLSKYSSSINEIVDATMNWGVMQQGTYNVEIKHINGTYWNGWGTQSWTTIPCFVGSNRIVVTNTLGLLVGIANDTATIRTATGSMTTTLNKLNATITGINGNVVYIKTALGPMNTTLNAINAKILSIDWTGIAHMSTTLGQVNATVNGIAGNVLTIKSNTNSIPDIKTNTDTIPNLTMPIYIAVVLSLIAAIAAILCAILVYRKIAT